jgi:energy-converting hydrogenase Eha subunit E
VLDKDEVLQWTGAFFITAGHVLNTMGSAYHKDVWNIAAFAVGTVLFLTWTIRVANKPQMAVNIAALATMSVGLFRAWA